MCGFCKNTPPSHAGHVAYLRIFLFVHPCCCDRFLWAVFSHTPDSTIQFIPNSDKSTILSITCLSSLPAIGLKTCLIPEGNTGEIYVTVSVLRLHHTDDDPTDLELSREFIFAVM